MVRSVSRFGRFVDRHPALSVVAAATVVVGSYLAWGVATVWPVLIPDQASDRCMAQAQPGDSGWSTRWELVPPGWTCEFYDNKTGNERRDRLLIRD